MYFAGINRNKIPVSNTQLNNPKLSVIVCTYNREKYIERNLESFIPQTLPYSEFEVILVNNNSPDNTDTLCKKFIASHPEIQITYVIETNQGHTYARNRGIKESKGDLLAFIDDDAFVRPEYCENIISFFKNSPSVDVIGGKIIPIYESGSEPKWMTPYLLTLMAAQDYGDETKEFNSKKFPIGANMIYRSAVFNKIGLFNVDLGRRGNGLEGGDEKDVIQRLRNVGGKIFYAHNVVVDHIIGIHREDMKYIKAMGIGVGSSEITRLKSVGAMGFINKFFEEVLKWSATIVLFFVYLLKLTPIKGWTLVKFRFWVLQGLLMGKN